MGLGPIEIVTFVFPGSEFTGDVLPELTRLVDNGIISIADGVFVARQCDGTIDTIELADETTDTALGQLGQLVGEVNGLLSDDDVLALTEGLDPGSSAAILVFEHTWALPLRNAIVGSGGYLLDAIRVPGPVVDEVLLAVAQSG